MNNKAINEFGFCRIKQISEGDWGYGGCFKSKRLHKLALPADSASRALECNINIQ